MTRGTTKPLRGIEELRSLRDFEEVDESFSMMFTLEGLVQLGRMWRASGWAFHPDRWTARQVNEALAGRVPTWDPKTEQPTFDDSVSVEQANAALSRYIYPGPAK